MGNKEISDKKEYRELKVAFNIITILLNIIFQRIDKYREDI